MNYILTIIDPSAEDVLTGICAELEIPVSVVFHGKGTAVKSMLELLGIESHDKRIFMAIAAGKRCTEYITEQKRKLHLGVPGHGITVAVPVKSVGGGKAVSYLGGGSGEVKYTRPEKFAYELIVVIVNAGTTDVVMNAARAAGARGGTVIHGKGTGSKDAQKFHHISIADEKDVVLIVAAAEIKAAIMRSVLEKAGPGTVAGAIVFSLPVSEAAGFGFVSDKS